LKRHILSGIRCGLRVWLAYGVVEFVLTCVVPMLMRHDTILPGWQWRLIGLVFGVYAFCGVVLGAAGGALLSWTGRDKQWDPGMGNEIMAALTLVVAFAANLIPAWPLARSEDVSLALAVTLAAGFAGSLASIFPMKRMAPLANPWTLSLLLLTWPWISREVMLGYSVIVKTTMSLVLMGLILGASVLLRRLWLRPIGMSKPVAAAAAMVILLLVALGSGTILQLHATRSTVTAATSGKYNVLLITMDTVRADHLSVYGYGRDTTPHLRDLAREATVYTRAIAASDMTLSSHASIFTGFYPSWHGAYVVPSQYPYGRSLSSHSLTLADVLRSNGYWTAAVAGNLAYLQPSLGVIKGFEVSDVHGPARLCSSHPTPYLREGARRVLSTLTDTSAFDALTLRAADINRRAGEALENAGRGRPFFIFLNYMDSHMPYVPPAPFSDRFEGRDPHFKPYTDHTQLTDAVDHGKRHVSATERKHLVSQYDGGIAYMDSEIGSLVDRLRESGLYENTLIIITGDHGEAFGERDIIQHTRGSAYQDQIHVPLLIKYPGQHEGRRSDDLVSHVDLMPTVLDVVGCATPGGLQGRSLRLPRAEDSDAVYAEARAAGELSVSPRFRGVRRAMFVGSWKLIASTEGPPELYDLAADPGETHNLYRADDPHAKALADRLSAWVAAAPRKFDEPGKLDKNSFEKLKSLGYAQ
jgi:arylsulfatase A-like enzyme